MKYMPRDFFSALFEDDSDGVRHNIPNAKYKKWEINSLGFRGKEFNFEKKAGQVRIVCFGASETFGVFENNGKEWPSQLGEMLRDKFPRVEVINVSLVGLKLEKRKDYIEKYVLPLKPDIVIMLPRFLLYIKDSIREVERGHLVNDVKRKKVKKSIKVPRSNSKLLLELYEMIKGILPEGILRGISIRKLQRKIRKKEKKSLINREPIDELAENTILEIERDLRSLIHYLKGNNVVPLLSTFPSLVTSFNKDVHKDMLLESRLLCIELSEAGIIDASIKFNQTVRRVTTEENVAFVDSENLIPKTLEYFANNYHYTDKGAELMAKHFCDILNDCKLIK